MATIDVSSPTAVTASINKLLKPGTKTSEFVTLIAVWAGALATLLGAFDTSSSRFNAILKVAALVAAAVSHVGYSLSRGDVKLALADVVAVLAENHIVLPLKPVDSSKAANPPVKDGGYVSNTVLWVLAVIGVVSLFLLLIGVLHH